MTASLSWPLSLMLTSLPHEFVKAVRVAANLGFTHVDPVALVERPATHLEALAESSVVVGCTPLGRDMPEGVALDANDVGRRRDAVDHVRRQIIDAARLGATCAYVVPQTRTEPRALAYFAEGCGLLAEFAARRMVRLCV